MSSLPRIGPPAPIVVDDPGQVEQILRSHFHFSSEHCASALEAGHARAALATDNSAVSQFGSDFYFGVIEQMRGDLATYSYLPRRYKGLELTRRSDNRVQLATCMACDGAGDVGGRPAPKNPKGSSSKKAIHDNQGTLGELAHDVAFDPIETWWLLYQLHGSERTRSISAELSLPNGMSSVKTFHWSIRLILPTLHLNESSEVPALPEPAAEVEVPVVRRVG